MILSTDELQEFVQNCSTFFFLCCLSSLDDPIGNVRRKAIELMPELKEISDDPGLNKKIEETFKHARKSEVDSSVKETLEDAIAKLNSKDRVFF